MCKYDELKSILLKMISKENSYCRDINVEILMELFCNKKYVELVELLTVRHVDFNIQDVKGRHILIYLLMIESEEVKNYDLDASDDMYLEIEKIGLSYEIMEVVELLLDKGAKINLEDKEGNVALDYAFKIGFFNVIRLLLERGAKISKASRKYVNAKLLKNVFEDRIFVKLLLEQDIDVNIKDDMGMTILMLASDKGEVDLVKYLISKGADVNCQNNCKDTALIIACEKGHFDVVDILLKENVNLDCKDLNGLTALMYACVRKHIGIVKLLLKKGVDLDIQDKKGNVALMLASSNEDEEIVKLLIEKGARVDVKNKGGFTLLNDLCRKRNTKILNIIVKKTDANSDINWIARLALGYINYEKFENIKELKKVVLTIPYKRKLKIYEQFLKDMEGKFEAFFDKKILIYKILMKADPVFFNILNTISQILNKGNNIGNSVEKLYLVMAGFCGMIRKYYSADDVFAGKFIESIVNSADNMMISSKKDEYILNIEKTLSKIKKEELLFLLTKTKAGNIHNIPQIVFKIKKGPLKDKYVLLLVNFGYGYNLNSLGASQASMYVFSMDTKDEFKKIARAIFEVSNDFGNLESDPSKIMDFYEKVHKLFFRMSKRIIKSVYSISEVNDIVKCADDVELRCVKTNKNLGIALRFDNNIPKNINNCFIKQQQKALELIFSILKTCYDKRNDPSFDIVSFMRKNSLDDNKILKYTHLNGLLICDIKEKKTKGIDAKKFKKEFVEEILKVAINGYKGQDKGIKKITKQEAFSIKREMFSKNGAGIEFVR